MRRPYDTLAWTAEWYFSAETLEAANAAIVNYHHRLPMTQAFGAGTLSSSDGQKFPVKGKSLTPRHLSRYFARGQGVSTYTHVSDQNSMFDTKVIAATSAENPYVLDGILGNQTDLIVTEQATDTHGANNANDPKAANDAISELCISSAPPAKRAGITIAVLVTRRSAHKPASCVRSQPSGCALSARRESIAVVMITSWPGGEPATSGAVVLPMGRRPDNRQHSTRLLVAVAFSIESTLLRASNAPRSVP